MVQFKKGSEAVYQLRFLGITQLRLGKRPLFHTWSISKLAVYNSAVIPKFLGFLLVLPNPPVLRIQQVMAASPRLSNQDRKLLLATSLRYTSILYFRGERTAICSRSQNKSFDSTCAMAHAASWSSWNATNEITSTHTHEFQVS